MPLWSRTVKPKWLTTEQKSRTSLTAVGWVYTHPNGLKEILVSMRRNVVSPETTNILNGLLINGSPLIANSLPLKVTSNGNS